MSNLIEQVEVRVGPLGRLVIPAPIRHALGIDPGSRLIARIDDGRLVLEKRETIENRLRERFRVVPADVSLADELIQERREAARGETGE
jgi:AbrB family looped-hinge helix DNA binding protein